MLAVEGLIRDKVGLRKDLGHSVGTEIRLCYIMKYMIDLDCLMLCMMAQAAGEGSIESQLANLITQEIDDG